MFLHSSEFLNLGYYWSVWNFARRFDHISDRFSPTLDVIAPGIAEFWVVVWFGLLVPAKWLMAKTGFLYLSCDWLWRSSLNRPVIFWVGQTLNPTVSIFDLQCVALCNCFLWLNCDYSLLKNEKRFWSWKVLEIFVHGLGICWDAESQLQWCRCRWETPLVLVTHSYNGKTFFFATCDSDEHCSIDATVTLLYVE